MIERSGAFTLEMFQKIEDTARKEKTATADIIRKKVDAAMKKKLKFPYKQPFHKQEVHRGYTQKKSNPFHPYIMAADICS